jgi:hypothetical protein
MTSENADVPKRSYTLSGGVSGGKATPGFGVVAAAILTVSVALGVGLPEPAAEPSRGATPVSGSHFNCENH